MSKYTIENYTFDIAVEEYISRFRNTPQILELCKQCGNYGKSWSCPPFDFDTDVFLRQYKHACIMVSKLIPECNDLQLEQIQSFILPERERIEQKLLEMEQKFDGHAFACNGICLYCPDSECTRKCGRPCRHIEKMRPPLEAFGFDIEHTVSELFGIELLWGKDGVLPEYIVLVSGFFHNHTSALSNEL